MNIKQFDVVSWLRNIQGLDDHDVLDAAEIQDLCESLSHDLTRELIGEVRKTIVDLKLQPSSGSMWANGEWSTNNKDKITSHNSALDSVLQLLDEAGGK